MSLNVQLSPASLAFTGTGTTLTRTVTPSEARYTGTFTANTPAAGQTNSCTNIATFAPATGTTFMVTPVGAGACTYTVAAPSGTSATLSVTVTVTNFSGS